ncbi:MAG: hypothetical protein ACRC92_26945 [Peptostreptococcaceae bacterium]
MGDVSMVELGIEPNGYSNWGDRIKIPIPIYAPCGDIKYNWLVYSMSSSE